MGETGLKAISAKDWAIFGLLALSIALSSLTLGIVAAGSSQRNSSASSNNLRVDTAVDLGYWGSKVTTRYNGGFEIKNGLLIRKDDARDGRTSIKKFPDEIWDGIYYKAVD